MGKYDGSFVVSTYVGSAVFPSGLGVGLDLRVGFGVGLRRVGFDVGLCASSVGVYVGKM